MWQKALRREVSDYGLVSISDQVVLSAKEHCDIWTMFNSVGNDFL